MEIYVVQRGDTVFSIANRYGVSAQRIISSNHITDPNNLVVGQALIILIPDVVYTVLPGDTLSAVAARFGITERVLLQNNPELIGVPFLTTGQTIVIRYQGEKLRQVRLNGYAYPYIQRALLERTLPYLTSLTIFGYGFTTEGELIPPADDQEMINLAYRYQTAPIMLLSSITESGTFSGERASMLFQNNILQNIVIGNVLEVMREKGYLGLDIDFEYINPDDREAFTRFLQNVTNRLHDQGFFVNTDLAPKTSGEQAGLLYESHDYRAIGAISDFVLLMTYEWGYTYGPPMAVAPLNQVRRVVDYAVTEIPREKIMMGLPNYGYDWILPFVRGVTRATTIGNDYAVEIASRNRAEIQFDQTAQSPFFEYRDANGLAHVVWFEDVRSMQAKFSLMDEFRLIGGGYWNIMRPFEQNWAFISARYDVQTIVSP